MSGFVVKGSGDAEAGGGAGEKMDMAKVLADPRLLSQLADFDEEQMRAQLLQLPVAVQGRLRALKKLQMESLELEAEFYRRVHELEVQFQPRFATLHAKRSDFVSGAAEPTQAEASEFPLIGGKGSPSSSPPLSSSHLILSLPGAESLEKELAEKVKLENGDHPKDDEAEIKGIPEFWLSAFKNVELISEMIQV